MERCIAHLDMDAFYVSVELRRRPDLRGRPVLVAGSGPRAVVTTASYEARRFGVRSAIPAARARRLCPEAIVLPPDFPHYREVSAAVMASVTRHVERVERIGLDEAYLDLSGLPAPRAAMRRILTEIHAATGLQGSVGIGPNKLVAKVASDAEKPRGFVVLSAATARERFAGAPPRLVPGIGPRTEQRLAELGLTTVGALAVAPPELLARTFGTRLGAELTRRARFEDDSPVSEERKVVSESREVTFDRDVADPATVEAELLRLVARLCEALADQRRRGRTVAIKVRLDDFSTHTRSRTLSTAVSEPGRVGPIALELLRGFGLPRPVRLVGVRVAGLGPAVPAGSAPQLSLLERV